MNRITVDDINHRPLGDIVSFSMVVESIYDSALDPRRWQATIELMAGLTSSSTAAMNMADHATGVMPLDFGYGYSADSLEAIRSGYGLMFMTIAGLHYLPVGQPKFLDDVIDEVQFVQTRFFREWVLPNRQRWWAGWVSYRLGSRIVINSLGRSIDQKPYSEADRQIMALLASHIQRALLISDAIDLRSVPSQSLEAALDALPSSVFLIKADATVCHMNLAARDRVRERRSLQLVNNRLSLLGNVAAEKLRRALLESAGSPDEDMAPLTHIALGEASDGDQDYVIVLPIRRGEREKWLRPFAASHAVFVHSPKSPVRLPGEVLAEAFSLSPAELQVLMIMAPGLGPQEVADILGVELSTVKTHLHRIFSKTGTSRQAELVALLSRYAMPVSDIGQRDGG